MYSVFEYGFAHSGIAGSKVVCTSPTLIAAYHALHRHQLPRHPLYALSSLRAIEIVIMNPARDGLHRSRYSLSLLSLCLPFQIVKDQLPARQPPIENCSISRSNAARHPDCTAGFATSREVYAPLPICQAIISQYFGPNHLPRTNLPATRPPTR